MLLPTDFGSAVTFMRANLRPLTLEHSLNFLRNNISDCEILFCYQQLFPRQYAESQASTELGDRFYSAKEQEFLKLIHDSMFPLEENVLYPEWNEYYAEYDRDYYRKRIPLETTLGNDFLENWHDFRAGYKLLVLLNGDIQDYWDFEYEVECASEPAPELKLIHWANTQIKEYTVDMQKLQQVCQQQPAPLRYLCDTIRHIQHNTDNFWLDFVDTWGMTVRDAEWNIDTLKYLAQKWTEASCLLSQEEELADWIEKSPKRNFKKVLNLWNQCLGR